MTATSGQERSEYREAEVLEELGRQHASGGRVPEVVVIGRRVHGGSVNLEVAIGDPPEERFLKWLTSAAYDRHHRSGHGSQPRLNPFPDPSTRVRHEGAALGMIEGMVERERNAEWSAVRVEEILETLGVLCLERVPWPTLTDRRERGGRGGARGIPDVTTAARSLGEWLRTFHRQDDLSHTRQRLDGPERLAELVDGLWSRLERAGRAHGVGPVRRWIASELAGLPRDLPLALAHGDLSPKNVLVDDAGRIAVVDTAADWRMPPHVDLAYLTVMCQLEDMTHIRPIADRVRSTTSVVDAVFAGYGPAIPPPDERRVFEVIVLLDKLVTLRDADVRRRSRLKTHSRRVLLDRRIRRSISQRMAHDGR